MEQNIWQIRDFSKGQIENVKSNILPDNATFDARNFIADSYGGLKKRKGRVLLGDGFLSGAIQGIYPYYQTAKINNDLIILAGGDIYIYNKDTGFYAVTLVATGVVNSDGTTITYVSGDEFSTIWGGFINIDGNNYEIASITSNTALEITENIGVQSGLDYTYQSGHTSILGHPQYPLFKTALFGEALFNEPSEAKIIFPLTTSVNIYLEQAVNYIVGMNGVDKPWKWDGNFFSYLANAPDKGNYPILHKEKLFCVDQDEPSTLIWSDTFAPESWTPTNYWDIRKSDGDVITCLIKYLDDLFVFKNRSLSILKGTSLDDFTMIESNATIGCVGNRAATIYDMSVFFISEYGLYVTDGMKMVNLTNNIIPDTWRRLNKIHAHKSTLIAWNDMLWFTIPVDNSVVPNLTILFDPGNGAFYLMEGIRVSCYTKYNDGTGTNLYSGSPISGSVYIEDTGTDDHGKPINAYWKGKYFDVGIPGLEKKSVKLFVQHASDVEYNAEIYVSTDFGEYIPLKYYRDKGSYSEYDFENEYNRWNLISPQIVHDKIGGYELKEIAIPYKTKTRLGVPE